MCGIATAASSSAPGIRRLRARLNAMRPTRPRARSRTAFGGYSCAAGISRRLCCLVWRRGDLALLTGTEFFIRGLATGQTPGDRMRAKMRSWLPLHYLAGLSYSEPADAQRVDALGPEVRKYLRLQGRRRIRPQQAAGFGEGPLWRILASGGQRQCASALARLGLEGGRPLAEARHVAQLDRLVAAHQIGQLGDLRRGAVRGRREHLQRAQKRRVQVPVDAGAARELVADLRVRPFAQEQPSDFVLILVCHQLVEMARHRLGDARLARRAILLARR